MDATPSDVDALLEDLDAAAQAYEDAQRRVEQRGEDALQGIADRYRHLQELFDRYEDRATGDGDFQVFIEFQGKMGEFAADLPEDVPHHDRYARVDDLMQQRRLTDADFRKAREALEPVAADVELLEERDAARERYRELHKRATRRMQELEDRIDDLERLQRLGEADLDAPVERLRDPIEAYNDAVREAFVAFRREESARTVLSFLTQAGAFPLVPFQRPPESLVEYVETNPAGEEPLSQLLEYADYSTSKLDHYVADPQALVAAVEPNRTYLRRLDADPLTISWPPPPAEELRWRLRELVQVVGRFAPEDVVARLRDLRAWTREKRRAEYDRLRESARSRNQLTDEQRERVASGAVDDELAAVRDARARLADRLDALPSV